MDWSGIVAAAERERVAPLLYHATRDRRLVPEAASEQLAGAYVRTGLANTLRLRETASILQQLSAFGVPVMVLKGLSLAERVYGNVALRPMVDSDVLVRRRDVSAALAALYELGYRSAQPEIAPDVALAFENEVMLVRNGHLTWSLEVHWSLFDSPFYQDRLSEESLWAGAVPITVEGAPAFTPSSPLELLHLCGHLVLHHRGRGLLWWNDIAEVIAYEGRSLNWDEVLSQAVALDLVMPLQAVLPTVAEKWGAVMPPDVPARLETLVPRPVEARVYALLTSERSAPGRRLLEDVQGMSGRGARLRFLLHNLFPSAAYMDERYGIDEPWQRPLYYVYRWWRGLGDLLRG